MKNRVINLVVMGAFVAPAFAQAGAKEVREKLMSYGAPAFSAIAHRGADWYAPEETAPSFILANEMGADYLECDLSLSSDGVLVVNHDDDFSRTTNVAKVFPGREKDPVGSFSWAEIQKLDAGDSYNSKPEAKGFSKHTVRDFYTGAKVLRLEQLLAIARSNPAKFPGVYLEAKAPDDFPEMAVQVAEEMVDVLKRLGWITGNKDSSRVIFQSFVPEAVAKFKELAPSVLATYLVGPVKTTKEVQSHIAVANHLPLDKNVINKNAVYKADILGPYILGILPDSKEKQFVDLIHNAGLGLHPWIIDDAYFKGKLKLRDGKKWALSLINMGVDGIFSDQVNYSIELTKPERVSPFSLETLVNWSVRNKYKKLSAFLNSSVFMNTEIKRSELDAISAKMRK